MSTTSITLEIDPARLQDPHVAQAVAAVMLAIEGFEARKAPHRAEAPKAKAPPAKPAPALAADPQSAYEAFFAQLPQPSQQFLTLLEKVGTLTISEAADELGIKKNKRIGGITGAISRWAPARGARVPFEKLTIEGERAWRWVGA